MWPAGGQLESWLVEFLHEVPAHRNVNLAVYHRSDGYQECGYQTRVRIAGLFFWFSIQKEFSKLLSLSDDVLVYCHIDFDNEFLTIFSVTGRADSVLVVVWGPGTVGAIEAAMPIIPPKPTKNRKSAKNRIIPIISHVQSIDNGLLWFAHFLH